MIYLDKNGITIKASKEAVVGEEYELNSEKYKVVDGEMLREMVRNREDVTKVVTTNLTNMIVLFANEVTDEQPNAFNQDISSWDVSNVTNMISLFRNTPFNQDISSWDVSNVTYMNGMFGETPFNQDIGSWDV